MARVITHQTGLRFYSKSLIASDFTTGNLCDIDILISSRLRTDVN